MFRPERSVLIGVALLVAAPASRLEGCQERTLSLRYSPQEGGTRYWCWAASGQMIMELLGEEPGRTCQCRQAQQVLGVRGCCLGRGSCTPAADLPARCDEPRWPAFVERPDRYGFDYKTTCDTLPNRQDDDSCDARPLDWRELTAEICAGRPVLASFRSPGSTRGHMVVVKGFSTHGHRRVLVVDPKGLCPPGRDCEGELDEGFWLSYEEYTAGWGGLVHWVDFYGIRRRSEKRVRLAPPGRKARAPVRLIDKTACCGAGRHRWERPSFPPGRARGGSTPSGDGEGGEECV